MSFLRFMRLYLYIKTICLSIFDNRYFQFSEEHDVMLCREVIVAQPYKFKPRSPERGKAWDDIASTLNAIQRPSFKVTARSVRDRYNLLTNRRAQKIRAEEKASGIDVDISELDELLEDILEREKEAKAALELQDIEKTKKVEKEKETAEQVRQQAMEKMSKRKSEESDEGGTKKKGRKSTADAIDYLKEKSAKEYELRKQEIDLKKQEQQQACQQQQDMMKALLNQMQQQQQQQQSLQAIFLAQQQQQSELLKALIEHKK